MSISMGTLRTAFGKSGSVSMSGLFRNGYTRVHSSGGYRKINPFQVEVGNAPDPASEGSTNHALSEFDGYSHTSVPAGTNLDATVENGKATMQWVKSDGYTRDQGNCTQILYWKDLGTTYDPDTEGDPFTSPTGSTDVGDVTTYELTGLTGGRYYAVGVKTRWNDSVADHNAAVGHAAESVLNDRVVSDSFNSGNSIVIGPIFNTTPVLDDATPSNEATCHIGGSDAEITINFSSGNGGPVGIWLDEKVGGGAWNTIETNLSSTISSHVVTGRNDGESYRYRARYGSGGTNGSAVLAIPDCQVP